MTPAVDDPRTAAGTAVPPTLLRWLDAQDLPGSGGPVHMHELSGGDSNRVYALERAGHRMVLRQNSHPAPLGRTDPMAREFQLVSALADTPVPHARALALCTDPAVLGSSFYVMQHVDGWSPAGRNGWPEPYDVDPVRRRGLSVALVDGLAELGAVDWKARGLHTFGRPEGFHERQVQRWIGQLAALPTRELPGLDIAATWLQAHQPDAWTAGIMHGDYQFANVMFTHGGDPGLAAIIDWELSTIGDPLLDLAWILMSDDWNADTFDLSGMPTQDEIVERYSVRSGRDIVDIDYYLILARFKMAAILESGYARSPEQDDDATTRSHFGRLAMNLARRAGDMARERTSTRH